MTTYIIDNSDIIKNITGKEVYKKKILYVNSSKIESNFESDYTLYELTERLEYLKVN